MSTGPLTSWDIFSESFHQTNNLIEDKHQLLKLADKFNWKIEWDIHEKIFKSGNIVIVTSPDLTIQFASSNILQMTGYYMKDLLGKTPAIFQGPETSDKTKKLIRSAVKELRPFHYSLINYRKNGSLYNCSIEAFPVFDKANKHKHFIAFEKET